MRYLMLASAAAMIATSGVGLAQNRPDGGYQGGRGGGGQGGGQGGGGQGGYQGGQGGAPAPAPAPAPVAAPPRPTGSFEASCRNVQVHGQDVTAECRNIHGRYPTSTLNFSNCKGDLSNNNGVLSCPGSGAFVPPGQDDGSNDHRGSNNNGQVAGGVAAGAVLGALLGGALNNNGAPPPQAQQAYPPGYAYPVYGDQRYGDPRYDPRYGQQGWGYGRRPGEWISIHDRADWLNRRIDHEVADGDMSRREARDIRRDLAGLEGLEDRYRRQGMAPWMREDLDRRFDGVAERVHQDGPPPRDDRNRGGYGR
ncbi:MAG TPA: hypothetical protein VG960_05300 [Caulobacteraceae bacterium]|nr:hypothetical protein [Caulobacteraceae bacterium]